MSTAPTPPGSFESHPQLSPDELLWGALMDYVYDAATPKERAAVEARAAYDAAYAALLDDARAIRALRVEQYIDDDGSVRLPDAGAHDPAPSARVTAAWERFARRLDLPPLPSDQGASSQAEPSSPSPGAEHTEHTEHAERAISTPPGAPLARPLRTPPSWYRRQRRALWATVAVFLFVQFGLRRLNPHSWHDRQYYHAGATAQTVLLPDGTTAWLAPGTYLATDRAFREGDRAVYLFGQARFTVAHDAAHPFTVNVLALRATALGTTFLIAGDTTARIRVAVDDGKVSLDLIAPNGSATHLAVLTAGDAQSVTGMSRFIFRSSQITSRAGVPQRESNRIYDALMRAAAAEAAAAARGGGGETP